MNNNRIIEGAKIQISNVLPFLVYFMTKQPLPVIFEGSPENFILIFVLLNFSSSTCLTMNFLLICITYIRRAVLDLQPQNTRAHSARVGGRSKSDAARVGML